jgi:hypothetical protein
MMNQIFCVTKRHDLLDPSILPQTSYYETAVALQPDNDKKAYHIDIFAQSCTQFMEAEKRVESS